MANLIITVISIALVAVAALMGAYYGGTAFMDGQNKAKANQIIEGARQVASAWQIYATERGGDYSLPNGDFAQDLVPRYVQTLPSFNFVLGQTDGTNWFYQYRPYTRSVQPGQTYGDGTANIVEYRGVNENVCKQINIIASNTTSFPSLLGNTSADAYLAYMKPFFCFNLGGAADNFFMYRAF